MKRLSMLAILVFSHTTFAGPTAADGSAPEAKIAEVRSAEAKTALALVSRDLIQPLAIKEDGQSKFSRARLPAQERRVRILDDHARKDARGVAFVRFAIDARHGYQPDDEANWRKDAITGCVYLDRSQIFIKRGDEFRPAAFLLGKNLKAAASTTCKPAAEQLAHSD
jgi:hypothetical protein